MSWGWSGGILYLVDFVLVRLGCPCLPTGDSAQVSPHAPWLPSSVHVGAWGRGAVPKVYPGAVPLSHPGGVAFPRLCPNMSPLLRPQPVGSHAMLPETLPHSSTRCLLPPPPLAPPWGQPTGTGSPGGESPTSDVPLERPLEHPLSLPAPPRCQPQLCSLPCPMSPPTPSSAFSPWGFPGQLDPLNPGVGRAGQGIPFTSGSPCCHPHLLHAALGCDLVAFGSHADGAPWPGT